MDKNLIKAVAVTADLTGTELTDIAARTMCEDLSEYPIEQVIQSLKRCRKELKGRLTTADVIDRLPDGRPEPEEAWAMLPRSEADSVIWSREMSNAYSACCALLDTDERIPARMAFLEAYRREVSQARIQGIEVSWHTSFGEDKLGRESAVIEAVEKKRITESRALELIPNLAMPGDKTEAIENTPYLRLIKKQAKKIAQKNIVQIKSYL